MKYISEIKNFFGKKEKTTNEQDGNKEPESLLSPEQEYIKRICAYDKYYLRLVVCIAAVMAMAIVVMVIKNWLIGTCVAIVCAILYSTFASDEMFKGLGLKYKSTVGSVCVTGCRAKYGNEFYVPPRIMWYDVTEISDRAFDSPKNAGLTCVHFPKSLTNIGENIFENCPAIERVCFEGSEEEWNKIEKRTSFDGITIEFNVRYPEKPSKKE